MAEVSTAASISVIGSSSSSGGGGSNVLSDKVNRALQVRTDTPAMRAALDALANLSTDNEYDLISLDFGDGGIGNSQKSSTSGGMDAKGASSGVIDAKSVRAAIERDALRRALDFQKELQKLGRDATKLRERVENVAQVANIVKKRVETQIIAVASDDISKSKFSEHEVVDETLADDGGASGGSSSSSTRAIDAWEAERNLVSHLAYSQRAYVEAIKRQVAVNDFLDKFDLGEDEARLLDHYNFEGFVASERYIDGEGQNPWKHPNAALHIIPNPSEEAMNDAMSFLNALERLMVIRRELTKTFGSGAENNGGNVVDGATEAEEGGQSLGTHSALRMMDTLASRHEHAHERLYQFIQFFLGVGTAAPTPNAMMVPTSSSDNGRLISSYDLTSYGALGRFRDGDEMDEAFNHPIIRRSVHVLRHSPAHHVHELELIAAARRTEVTRRFLLALTSGYGGMAPLEMKAHDPVGYVGDMLAFAFRAFRVEGELFKTLLMWDDSESTSNVQEGTEKGVSHRNGSNEGEFGDKDDEEDMSKPMNVITLLAQSMGGLARPLRSRVSQVVYSLASQGVDGSGSDSHSELTIRRTDDDDEDIDASSSLNRLAALFSICGLLRFYHSAVLNALDKLEQDEENGQANNPFFIACEESLTEAADSFIASLRAFGAMLVFHSAATSEAQVAKRVITCLSEERANSPGFSEDVQSFSEGDDEVDKQLSLSSLVGTMIESAMPHLKTLDDCAALKSALTIAMKSGLSVNELATWSKLIQEAENTLVESFVNSETDEVLHMCGLDGVGSALRHMNGVYVEGMTMASHPGLAQRDLESSMKKFYSSLFSPPIPTFEDTIKDPGLRKIARSKTAQRVVDVYQELYDAITSDKGGYADVSFLSHDPDQVQKLLSL